jgi:hypothetical protein
MYGWLLELVGADQMLRYSVYVQLVASALTWGGFLLTSRGLSRSLVTGLTLTGKLWWLAYPGTWFAAWVSLASGSLSEQNVVAATLSVVLLIVLAMAIWGKMSFEYVDRVSQLLATTSGRSVAVAGTWLGGLTNETRAVTILVRSQLRNNMKFRLAVASIVPITVVYMVMGGWPRDPFVERHAGEPGGSGLYIQMALLFLPQTLRRAIVSSDTHEASWIFYTTPADRGSLVLSARNVIAIFFLVPYMAVLAALFAYAFGSPLHALIHGAFLGMLSFLVLEWEIAMFPRLPFSVPIAKAAAERAFLVMMVAVIVGTAFVFLLEYVVYRRPSLMIGTALALVAIAIGLDRLTRSRARTLFPEAVS